MELKTEIDLMPAISLALIVLLILLLISPFLGESRIKVDLPRASTSEMGEEQKITITLSRDGRISVDEKLISLEKLKPVLSQRFKIDPYNLMVIKADKNISYGEVETVLEIAKESGAGRIAIATVQKMEVDKKDIVETSIK
ncbi:Tol-Pal system protein TolR [subsurface metagenome]